MIVSSETSQSVSTSADGTHEVQAETVKVWLSLRCELGEFGVAADANPLGVMVRLTQ